MTTPSQRTKVYPADHYRVTIEVPTSMGLISHGLTYTAGQPDMIGMAEVRNPGDHLKQTDGGGELVRNVYRDLERPMSDICKVINYVGNIERVAMDAIVARTEAAVATDHPVATAIIPLPEMIYPGMDTEIEVFGEAGGPISASRTLASAGRQFYLGSHGFGTKGMALGEAVDAAMDEVEATLSAGGHALADVVRLGVWFETSGGMGDWATVTARLAQRFPTVRPVLAPVPADFTARDGSGPTVLIDGVGIHGAGANAERVLARDVPGCGAWPIEAEFPAVLRDGDLIYCGGHGPLAADGPIVPGDLEVQTDAAMASLGATLAHFEADFEAVVKVTAYYSGRPGTDDYKKTHRRATYFTKPGPTSVGAVVPRAFFGSMTTIIEAIAMVDD